VATFTINEDNNITAFATAAEAAQAGDSTATTFDSQAALAKVSADWPLSRFVDIWNSIPGNSAVSKFADRKKAVARVWTAILPLAGNAQASEPEAKPTEPTPDAKPKKSAKGVKPAKKAKAAKKAAPVKAAPAKKSADKGERSNKKAEVTAMMKRAKGVTLAEIMEVTGWQPHTVRGFVSILGSKGGETIESSKNPAGERMYRIVK
jgi:hypothetical protein